MAGSWAGDQDGTCDPQMKFRWPLPAAGDRQGPAMVTAGLILTLLSNHQDGWLFGSGSRSYSLCHRRRAGSVSLPRAGAPGWQGSAWHFQVQRSRKASSGAGETLSRVGRPMALPSDLQGTYVPTMA